MKREILESYEIEIRKAALLAAAGLRYTSKKLPIDGTPIEVIVEKICDAVAKTADHFDGKVKIKVISPNEEEFFIYVAGGIVIGSTIGFAVAGIPGAALGGVVGGLFGAAASAVTITMEISNTGLQLVTE